MAAHSKEADVAVQMCTCLEDRGLRESRLKRNSHKCEHPVHSFEVPF